VNDVNRHLSHPEQVKRWAVLPNDLSIANGDLTANLKLRRREVERRFADEIDRLYGGERATLERSAMRAGAVA
jgi:long-chain acyl-CoA synthetase